MIDHFEDEDSRLMAEKIALRLTVIAGLSPEVSESYAVEFVETLKKSGWKTGQDYGQKVAEMAQSMYEAGRLASEHLDRIRTLASENEDLHLENANLKSEVKDLQKKADEYDRMMSAIGVAPAVSPAPVPVIINPPAAPGTSWPTGMPIWSTTTTSHTGAAALSDASLAKLAKGPGNGKL